MSADTTQCCGGVETASAPVSAPARKDNPWLWHGGVAAFTLVWFLIYKQLPGFSEWLTGGTTNILRVAPCREKLIFATEPE